MQPVKDNPEWFRDNVSLVNTDINAFNEYKAKKAAATSRQQEIDGMKKSINNINDEISGMKDTLSQILTLLQK